MRRLTVIILVIVSATLTGWMVHRGTAADRPVLRQRFDAADANQDGKVTPEELGDSALFAKLDTNRDGEITLAEARIAILAGALKTPPATETPAASSPSTQGPIGKPADTMAPVRQGPQPLNGAAHGVGRRVTDVEFVDLQGTSFRLSAVLKERGAVIAVTSTTCPLSRKYFATIAALAPTLKERGLALIVINPVATDSRDEMQADANRLGEHGFYVRDANQHVSQSIGLLTTTDTLLVDSKMTVRYHGAIDDQYGFGYAKNLPTEKYLETAITAVLNGIEPRIAATQAPGCSIDQPERTTDAVRSANSVSYHNQVSRIMQSHCVECHRQGGVGPFELDTFADVVAHAPMIKEVISRGIMPPWFATAPADGAHSPWENDRTMAEEERRDLLAWIDGNRTEGNPSEGPLPRQFPVDWVIGTPDVIYEFASPITVKAHGTMPYQDVTIETELPEDKWVQAVEIRPGAPEVVHHVLVFVKPPANSSEGGETTALNGRRRRLAREERDGFFAAYVPGTSTFRFDAGYGKRLPKGSTLVFQMHYTPNGTATTDSTRIGMIFSKSTPAHEVKVHGIANGGIRIPAGAGHHQEEASIRLPGDITVLGFVPHMHLRGKACKYEVVHQDGKVETVLDIPRYDFNWQLNYRFQTPLSLAKGETIRFTGWFDNSASNPANPAPDQEVKWGPQTDDEMLIGYIEYVEGGL